MSTKYNRLFAFLLTISLVTLFTSLLVMSKLSDEMYLGLFLITVASGFALFFSDRLIEMNLKEGKFLLSEAKATNEATKELAVATLDLIDASRDGLVVYNHDKEAYQEAREKLVGLCDKE